MSLLEVALSFKCEQDSYNTFADALLKKFTRTVNDTLYRTFVATLRQYILLKDHVDHFRITDSIIPQYESGKEVCPACTGGFQSHEGVHCSHIGKYFF